MSSRALEPSRPPAVSVVLTCYNLGRYLGEALDSVLGQSFQDFEIVLVDDGSTDAGTQRLLTESASDRTHVIRSSNRGLPAARNLGIGASRGRYICSFDADDVLEPTLIEKSVAALENDASLAFVSHWLRAFGDENWEWTPTNCGFPALLDMNTINGAALVRRTAIEAVGGYDETMRQGCEDWDLWISLVERGFNGAVLPEFLFNYRRRPDSMSRNMLAGDGHAQLYRRLVEKHRRSYEEHLPDLLLRRERDAAHLSRHIQDLELERARWMIPELAKRRDDVLVFERQLDQVERRRALEAARTNLAKLEPELAESRRREAAVSAEAAEREREHAKAVELVYELDARANRAEAEANGLRRSMSWRMTAPARAVVAAIQRLLGSRP